MAGQGTESRGWARCLRPGAACAGSERKRPGDGVRRGADDSSRTAARPSRARAESNRRRQDRCPARPQSQHSLPRKRESDGGGSSGTNQGRRRAMISDGPNRFALVCAFAAAACIALLATSRAAAQVPSEEPGVIAHEWGTFTSIAGTNGEAIDWLPLTASVDSPGFVHRDLLPLPGLPGFVYHSKKHLKFGLRGTIRMETPVLYFYTSRDLTLSVHVSFTKGLITEWYPSASEVTPTEEVTGDTLYKRPANGILIWDSVMLEPHSTAGFPRDAADSRYYPARETSSTPLRVTTALGAEHEKFLFYRGVSTAPAA